MQKLQGWVEQGNTTLTIGQAAGVIALKVQGSFPGATVTVYINAAPDVAISSISRTANVVTVTIPAGSGFIAGEQVTIAGVTDASFNGTFTILISGATTFTYTQTAANASSSGGTATSTLRLATIYSDNISTAKANPFVSASDGTWFFYVDTGHYDVKFSGGGIAALFTLSDWTAISMYAGTGSPEGSVIAGIGSLYVNSSGGTSTTLYVKTSGSGNTGWTAK